MIETLLQREDLGDLIGLAGTISIFVLVTLVAFAYFMSELILRNWPKGVERVSLRLITAIGIAVVSGAISGWRFGGGCCEYNH